MAMTQNRSPMSELGVSERALAFAASLADMEEQPVPQQINFNPPVKAGTPGMQPAPVRAAPPPPRPQDPLAAYPGAPPQAVPQRMMQQMPAQQMQQPPVMRAPPQIMSDYVPEAPTYGSFQQQQQEFASMSPGPQAYPMATGPPAQPMHPVPERMPQEQSPARPVLLPGLRPSQQASPQVQRAAPPPAPQAMPQPGNEDMQRKYNELEGSLKAMESERGVLVREQEMLRKELERLVASAKEENVGKASSDDATRQYTERLEAEKEDL